jgi:predicted porin
MVGLGVTHSAMKGKLQLGGDVTMSRSRSNVDVFTGATAPAFPTAKTSVDTFKLFATYRLRENTSIVASYWYENMNSRDWHLDGLLPDTVPNLLAFGELAPRYHVNVFRVALRHRF